MTEAHSRSRLTGLNPVCINAFTRWHEMAAIGDLSRVSEIAREDVIFRSPAVYKAYQGREALKLILTSVIQVFENFTYHRHFLSEDGMSAALEFSAEIGGRELKGADFIRFDDEGLIAEFEVMVRPATGLMALGQAMGAKLEGKQHLLKGEPA